MPPKTQKIRTLQNIQNKKIIDTIQAEPIPKRRLPVKKVKQVKQVVEEYDEENEENEEYEEYDEYEEPQIVQPVQPVQPVQSKKKKNFTPEQIEAQKQRLELARMKREQEAQQKKLLEQQYLLQKEKEIEVNIKKKYDKKAKQLERKLINKYLAEQAQKQEEEYYEEDEIEVKPTRITRQPKYNNGGGYSAPPSTPVYPPVRFV